MRAAIAIVVAAVTLMGEVSAQLRIIPQSRLDSVNNPQQVSGSKIVANGGRGVDLGRIDEQAAEVKREIEWRNRADKIVAITHIKSSCSCLKARFIPEGVKPGGCSRINITYYPKGHPGAINQRLFIYTNLSDDIPSAILDIGGYVIAGSDHRADYPYSLGYLLLRTCEIALPRGTTGRIACMNSGSKELRIREDGLLTTKGIRVSSQPEVLKPGEEGDLVITTDPTLSTGDTELFIDGVSLPPRERKITIKIE